MFVSPQIPGGNCTVELSVAMVPIARSNAVGAAEYMPVVCTIRLEFTNLIVIIGSAEFVEVVLTVRDWAATEFSGKGTDENESLPVALQGVPARRFSLVLALNRNKPMLLGLMKDALNLIAGTPWATISSTVPAVQTEVEPSMNVVDVKFTNKVHDTL